MRKLMVVMVAACFTMMACQAYAQDDARRALAEQLLDEMNMKENIEKSFEMVKKMIPAQIERVKQTMKKDKSESKEAKEREDASEKMMAKMMDMIGQEVSWENLKQDYVTIYAETFTEDELRGIIAFYKTPVGQAFKTKQPEVMERSMKVSQKQMMQLMPKIQAMLQEARAKKATPPVPTYDPPTKAEVK